MTGIPAAVAHQIATRTGLDPRVGRRAHAGTCTTCAAPVIRGLDADMCAGYATTDPARLTPAGELLAVLTGRTTYTLDGHPPELTRRDHYDIKTRPPTEITVIPNHTCGARPLPAFPDINKQEQERGFSEPPF